MAGSRYDGLAAWYDDAFGWYATADDGPGAELVRLLGPGPGLVLDVGCGTGLSVAPLRDAGWTVGGVDESLDQLARAAGRCAWRVRADAVRLPFATASVPRAALMFVHTDVDDYQLVLREVARVVAPGGSVAHIGVHPCFVGHHVERATRGDTRFAVVDGYRERRWVRGHENFGSGVRGPTPARHVPLAELVNAFAATGLCVEEVSETGAGVAPWMLSVRARRR